MNREQRRAQERRAFKANNAGVPMYSQTDDQAYRTGRARKKALKRLNRAYRSGLVYRAEQLKLSKKIVKKPSKYSDVEVKRAETLIEKVENYPVTMIEMEESIKAIRKLVA